MVAIISVVCFLWLSMAAHANHANEDVLTVGVQQISLSAGPVFPLRLTPAQSSKLFGEQTTASWAMTITEPRGKGVFDGALSLGVEAVLFHTRRPAESYNGGAMPYLRHVFGSRAVVRPYLEGGGGGIWGDTGRNTRAGIGCEFSPHGRRGAVMVLFSPHCCVPGLSVLSYFKWRIRESQ